LSIFPLSFFRGGGFRAHHIVDLNLNSDVRGKKVVTSIASLTSALQEEDSRCTLFWRRGWKAGRGVRVPVWHTKVPKKY